MMRPFLLLLSFLCLAALSSCQSIGDELHYSYTKYYSLPMTTDQATAAGWITNQTGCDPNLGIQWVQASTAQESKPISLYFTPAGQVAGIGVTIYGDAKQNLIDLGYWQPTGKMSGYQTFYMSVSFRTSDDICSDQTSDLPLGDSLIINANNISIKVPLTETNAIAGSWTKGACFGGMGTHYFYDFATAPNMSWVAANLLPIVPMYFNGEINAIFFASSTEQQSLFDANEWDPIPLINDLMCKNWCDSSCTFSDTSIWSTLHVYLKDYTQVTCPGGCKISCCPGVY